MARRRTAAAGAASEEAIPGSDAATAAASPTSSAAVPLTELVSDTAAVSETPAAPKPRRSRGPRKQAASTETDPAATPAATGELSPVSGGDAPVPPPSTRPVSVATDTEPEPVDGPNAEADAPLAPTDPAATPEVTAAEAKPARRRAPRRAKPVAEMSENALAPGMLVADIAAAAEPLEPVGSPEPPAEESVAPEKPKRGRRRGGAKRDEEAAPETIAQATVATDAIHALTDAIPETTPPAEDAAAAPIAEPEPAPDAPLAARSRRRRGKTGPAVPADTTAEPPLTVELRTEAPSVVDLVDPPADVPGTGAPETQTTPRRTRGVHKPKTGEGAAAEIAGPSYQALPAETLAHLAEARIVVRKNVPELIINSEAWLPFFLFVNMEDPDGRDIAARQIKGAYAAGIRFFTFLAHLPWKSRTGERRTDRLDDALGFVASLAPDAFLLPRLIFSPPVSWERTHEPEMTLYPDGEAGDVSLGSRAFWEDEAEPALRAAVEHVAVGPHAARVFGFYLEHGEWFHDFRRGFDTSAPNVSAFRGWLRAAYKNDVIALRAAWHDGGVTFEAAEIPKPAAAEQNGGPLNVLYNERECRFRDFHAFSSDIVVQVITRLGRAVKEASGNRSLVAVSYGYSLELPRAASGHLALGTMLASPFVDILTGPYSYAQRLPGGSAGLPAPVGSVALAGKLWISEDDTKTFLARGETPDHDYNPRVTNAGDTLAVHVRNAGAALSQGAGVSWMDLWGEGWLDDAQVWDNIGRLRDVAERLATRRRNPRTRPFPAPDVAVIVDERSFFGVKTDERLLGQLVAGQRDVLLRSGARVGFYLLSDLVKGNFPDTPRLFLFLNAFRIPADVREAIRTRLQNNGRTLAWLFAPGCGETGGEETPGALPGELTDVVGMHLRLQAWGSKMGTLITDARSPLGEGRRGQKFGDETRVNPSYTIADPKAQIVGEYAATGNPSLAVRKHGVWQSVFVGETTLTAGLLRGLYRLAGVPVYTDEDDVTYVGDSLVCLHSSSGGPVLLTLPEEATVYDVVRGETLARNGRGQRLLLRPRETRLLFYGTPAEVSRLGGDPNNGPDGLTAAELPPSPPPFAFEPSAAPPDARRPVSDRAASPEDEDLMAAVLSGATPFVDKDADPDATENLLDDENANVLAEPSGVAVASDATATEGKKKRRRRRGGRRGHADETASAQDTLPADETAGEEDPATNDLLDALDINAADFAPTTPSGRALPPLSELLPDSEVPQGGSDLPPVPDELLPLGADEVLRVVADDAQAPDPETTENENTPGADAAQPPAAARRRRGGRGVGRTRRTSDASSPSNDDGASFEEA